MKVVLDALIIEEIQIIESQLNKLYEQKKDLIKGITLAYPNETELKICGENSDGTWSRFGIIDNCEALKDGFWKSVKVDRFSSKLETLKNMPKELKEVKQ